MRQERVDEKYKEFASLSSFVEDYLCEKADSEIDAKDSTAMSGIAHEIYKSIFRDIMEYVQDEDKDLKILIGLKSKFIDDLQEAGLELVLERFDETVGYIARLVVSEDFPQKKMIIFDELSGIEELILDEIEAEAKAGIGNDYVSVEEVRDPKDCFFFFEGQSYQSLPLETKVAVVNDMYSRFKEIAEEDPEKIGKEDVVMLMEYLCEYLKTAYDRRDGEEGELIEASSELFLNLKQFYDSKLMNPKDKYVVTEHGLKREYTLGDEIRDRIHYERARLRVMQTKPEVDEGWVTEEVKKDVNRKLFEALCYLHDGFPQSAMNAVGYIRRKIASMPEEQVIKHAFLYEIEDRYLIDIDKEIEHTIKEQEQRYSQKS